MIIKPTTVSASCANCRVQTNMIAWLGVPDSTVAVIDGGPRPNPGQAHVALCRTCQRFAYLICGEGRSTLERFMEKMIDDERASKAIWSAAVDGEVAA